MIDCRYAKLYQARAGGKDVLPVRWMAPECITSNSFSQKRCFLNKKSDLIVGTFPHMGSCFFPRSDVWSFGVVMYEIFSIGCVPYFGKTNKQVRSRAAGERRGRRGNTAA